MQRLLVFLKYPTPGQVKTRLAARLGPDAAAEIYRTCAQVTLTRLAEFQDRTVVCVEPPESIAPTQAWLGAEWRLRPQQGQTLGHRLAEAISDAFQQGVQHVIAIGTDSPWLQPRHIHAAFDLIKTADLIVGPTEDGGYYLIGLSRPAPELFEGIAWSSSEVCRQTIDQAKQLGLSYRLLPVGYDIDHVDDVKRFLADQQRSGPSSSPS